MSAQLQRDARNRALRVFLQGVAIDVAVAVSLLVLELTKSAELPQWRVLALSFARTILGAVASYVMRRFVDRSSIPTPLPPDPPGEPDADV